MFIRDWIKVIIASFIGAISSYFFIDFLLGFRLHSLFIFICLLLIFFFLGWFIREHINLHNYKTCIKLTEKAYEELYKEDIDKDK